MADSLTDSLSVGLPATPGPHKRMSDMDHENPNLKSPNLIYSRYTISYMNIPMKASMLFLKIDALRLENQGRDKILKR